MKNKYDIVIIGSGVAGLYAALNLDEDISALVLSKRELTLSNSSLAQGGVAAVPDKNHDNYKLHIADTLIAGKFKNNLSAVEKLVTEGPSDVMRLKEIGVEFDTETSGELSKTLEAGHSRNRIVHHKDSTGKAIVDTLIEAVRKKPNIEIVENALVYAIDKVEGGFYLDILLDGENVQVGACYTLIATGGIGRIYKYTTNSAIATGDGIALAHMLGAKISHLSRIQFHPTAFAAAKNRERFLISEAVRGEGAVYLNCNGERFAFDYDPRGELAPRDVVSNAVIRESIKTGSRGRRYDGGQNPCFSVPALPYGRHKRRTECPDNRRGTLRRGRMYPHGSSRRKPSCEQFASRSACVFAHSRREYERENPQIRQSRAFRRSEAEKPRGQASARGNPHGNP